MANNAEVVLGSGSMLHHEPFHYLINDIDWINPTRYDCATLASELVDLVKITSDRINKAADDSTSDCSEMDEILIERGIKPGSSDDEEQISFGLQMAMVGAKPRGVAEPQ